MDKKEQKLNMILELSSLINSTILFDNNLLKVIKINSIYISAKLYLYDNEIAFIFQEKLNAGHFSSKIVQSKHA